MTGTADSAAKPSNLAKLELETLRDDAELIASRRAGKTDRLVVCFSSIGSDPAVNPLPEWKRLAGRDPSDHLLFLADPARSWLNRPGLIEEMAAVIEAEAERVQALRVVAIGHSLGGFSALVMPAFTRIDVAAAFSPQYSIDPAVVPTEWRWEQYRNAIQDFRIHSANDHLRPECLYFVFLGARRREHAQRRQAKALPNLDYYVMAETLHDTPGRMKKAKILDTLIDACFDQNRDRVQELMIKAFDCTRQPVTGE